MDPSLLIKNAEALKERLTMIFHRYFFGVLLGVLLAFGTTEQDQARADALGLAQGSYTLFLDSFSDWDTTPNYTGYISIGATGVTAFRLQVPPADWSLNMPPLANDSVLLNTSDLFSIQDTQLPGNTGSILFQLDAANLWAFAGAVNDWGTWSANYISGPVAQVPEPSTFLMLLIGLGSLFVYRARVG